MVKMSDIVGAVKGQGQGTYAMAKRGLGIAGATAAGRHIKAHPKRSAVAGLMGAGAMSSKRRGRGTSPTRGIPRGIYKH